MGYFVYSNSEFGKVINLFGAGHWASLSKNEMSREMTKMLSVCGYFIIVVYLFLKLYISGALYTVIMSSISAAHIMF